MRDNAALRKFNTYYKKIEKLKTEKSALKLANEIKKDELILEFGLDWELCHELSKRLVLIRKGKI